MSAFSSVTLAADKSRANLIVILADDMGVTHDKGYVYSLFIGRGFRSPHHGMHSFIHRFAVAVTAQMIAVIGGKTHDRILGDPELVKRLHQSARLCVYRGDITAVLGNFPRAHSAIRRGPPRGESTPAGS